MKLKLWSSELKHHAVFTTVHFVHCACTQRFMHTIKLQIIHKQTGAAIVYFYHCTCIDIYLRKAVYH
jgi:hypothetical protein